MHFLHFLRLPELLVLSHLCFPRCERERTGRDRGRGFNPLSRSAACTFLLLDPLVIFRSLDSFISPHSSEDSAMKSSSFSSSSSTSSSVSPSLNSSDSFSSHPGQAASSSITGSDAQDSSFHTQADGAAVHEDGVESESYERSFWANIFEEGSMVEHLLEGDEAMEEETKSGSSAGARTHPSTLDGGDVDSTPSSALLDQWNHYDDGMDCSMAEFSAPQMAMASSAPSGSLFSQSLTYQQMMNGPPDHEVYVASLGFDIVVCAGAGVAHHVFVCVCVVMITATERS